jgi:hypothetical protein
VGGAEAAGGEVLHGGDPLAAGTATGVGELGGGGGKISKGCASWREERGMREAAAASWSCRRGPHCVRAGVERGRGEGAGREAFNRVTGSRWAGKSDLACVRRVGDEDFGLLASSAQHRSLGNPGLLLRGKVEGRDAAVQLELAGSAGVGRSWQGELRITRWLLGRRRQILGVVSWCERWDTSHIWRILIQIPCTGRRSVNSELHGGQQSPWRMSTVAESLASALCSSQEMSI